MPSRASARRQTGLAPTGIPEPPPDDVVELPRPVRRCRPPPGRLPMPSSCFHRRRQHPGRPPRCRDRRRPGRRVRRLWNGTAIRRTWRAPPIARRRWLSPRAYLPGRGAARFLVVDEPALEAVAMATGASYAPATAGKQLSSVLSSVPKDLVWPPSAWVGSRFAALGRCSCCSARPSPPASAPSRELLTPLRTVLVAQGPDRIPEPAPSKAGSAPSKGPPPFQPRRKAGSGGSAADR